ncbi:MAG: (R)-2-hydroxyacyl-CoA dehydratese activating ATPase [Clostridia bacterium]|jgi:predicted CoA-substrate-specific enzyme activase|nr:CoA-substrate-specific enzyme activase [Clostridiales bacterium]MDK2985270.1 (R)-2-hydroxyacyl-CoA dehydratese activating ATPase [Clostridia bacterium]
MITVGIDIGSTATKAVLFTEKEEFYHVMPTGWSPKTTGEEIYKKIIEISGCAEKNIDKIVVTGYGRETISFAQKVITEITCHAKGASYLVPGADLVIDIGGQDSKVIKIDDSGRVIDFIMNDKCAAGTGKFLEVTATALGLDVSEMARHCDFQNMVSINSMCTVFAESEVISLLAQGTAKEKIVAGLHNSIASRIANMSKKLGSEAKIAFTGGVALNRGIQEMLQEHLNADLVVSEKSQFAGAIGAALLARES